MAEQVPVILDAEHLSAYTSGDMDLQAHVLRIFLENVPIYMAALSNSDNTDWRRDAHKLKGAARSIGARKIAALAEKAEKAGAAASPGDKRQILEDLEAAIKETDAFIEAHYFQDKVLY